MTINEIQDKSDEIINRLIMDRSITLEGVINRVLMKWNDLSDAEKVYLSEFMGGTANGLQFRIIVEELSEMEKF